MADAATVPDADGDSFTWIGGASGSWNDASNWATGPDLTPATRIPGASDSVSISSATISGYGLCDTLTMVGVTLVGDVQTGLLSSGNDGAPSNSTVSDGGSLKCSSATIVEGNLIASGTGSTIIVDGAVQGSQLEGGTGLYAANGGLVQIGSFGNTEATDFGTDSTSSFEIGHAGGAPVGVVTIDPGAVYTVGFVYPTTTSTINDGGVIVTQPGSFADLDVLITGAGAIEISAGSGLGLDEQPVGSDLSIQFAGDTGQVSLAATDQQAQPDIVGFGSGDDVHFDRNVTGAAYRIDGPGSATVTLGLADGGTDDLTFLGDFTGEGFACSVQYGQADLTLVPCFCPGTLVMTPTGERPVEAFRVGDMISTAAGDAKPVLWIGRRSYGHRFAAGRKHLQPIRIRQGALGDGLPQRDLLVSPCHAMLVNDVLVPAGLLVNDRSILREDRPGDVHYLHIELEDHDLLLAEGSPSESFVDDRSRAMFHNAAEYWHLYPDRPTMPPRWCLPRVEDGPLLVAARDRVNRVAGLEDSDALPPLRGSLDEATSTRLRGWAWCPAHEHAPVLLDVLVDGRLVEQVLANRFRADLAVAGIGAGCHAFELAVAGARPGSAITVRRSADGMPLPGVSRAA